MVDIRNNFSYYIEKMELLDSIMDNCGPLLGPEELAEELEEFPDFENLVFDLGGYSYDSRDWIFKSDVEEFWSIFYKKMDEYKKYMLGIAKKAGVSQAFLSIR
jgi:hypothetical protein